MKKCAVKMHGGDAWRKMRRVHATAKATATATKMSRKCKKERGAKHSKKVEQDLNGCEPLLQDQLENVRL